MLSFATANALLATCFFLLFSRGRGFFIGIELVTDRENRTPATVESALVKHK